MKVNDLNRAEWNPRLINDDELQRLEDSMDEFGDLSGIVFNERTNRLVGGHQRSKIIGEGTIESRRLKTPTKTGTVAYGYITHEDTRFAYRVVDWDEDKERRAMVAANQHGGRFDDEKLASMIREIEGFDTGLAGFSIDDLDKLFPENHKTKEKQNDHSDASPTSSSTEKEDDDIPSQADDETTGEEAKEAKVVLNITFDNSTDLEEFQKKELALREHYGTESVAETVLAVLENQAISK